MRPLRIHLIAGITLLLWRTRRRRPSVLHACQEWEMLLLLLLLQQCLVLLRLFLLLQVAYHPSLSLHLHHLLFLLPLELHSLSL